jgi:hypothetical protein
MGYEVERGAVTFGLDLVDITTQSSGLNAVAEVRPRPPLSCFAAVHRLGCLSQQCIHEGFPKRSSVADYMFYYFHGLVRHGTLWFHG